MICEHNENGQLTQTRSNRTQNNGDYNIRTNANNMNNLTNNSDNSDNSDNMSINTSYQNRFNSYDSNRT